MEIPGGRNITAVDGHFMMDGVEYDLDTIILALQMERVEVIDNQITDQVNEMKKRNAELAKLNNVMAAVRSDQDTVIINADQAPPLTRDERRTVEYELEDQTQLYYRDQGRGDLNAANERKNKMELLSNRLKGEGNVEVGVSDIFSQYGLTFDTGTEQANKDKNLANLKGVIDSLNSNSQLDQIRLQGLMNKRNQAFEMMTNTLSKLDKVKSSIIANIR